MNSSTGAAKQQRPITRAEARQLAIHILVSGVLNVVFAVAALFAISSILSGDAPPALLRALGGMSGSQGQFAAIPFLLITVYFWGSLWLAAARLLGSWRGGAVVVVAFLLKKLGMGALVAAFLLWRLWKAARTSDAPPALPTTTEIA